MKEQTYNILDKYTVIVFQVSDKLPDYLGDNLEEKSLNGIKLFKQGIYFKDCYKIHTNNIFTRLYYNVLQWLNDFKL